MNCEMCGYSMRDYWRQRKPVQRDICHSCAKKDQFSTHPKEWVGEFVPAPSRHTGFDCNNTEPYSSITSEPM
jgi:hypothetical protein